MKNVTITLLNDGETFTSTEGTSVCVVAEKDLELLQEGAPLSEWRYLERYDLTNPVHLRLLADRIEKGR
jgi:hypothetical protein